MLEITSKKGETYTYFTLLEEIPIKQYIHYCVYTSVHNNAGSSEKDFKRHYALLSVCEQNKMPTDVVRSNMSQLSAMVKKGVSPLCYSLMALFDPKLDTSKFSEKLQEFEREGITLAAQELTKDIQGQLIRGGTVDGEYSEGAKRFVSAAEQGNFFAMLHALKKAYKTFDGETFYNEMYGLLNIRDCHQEEKILYNSMSMSVSKMRKAGYHIETALDYVIALKDLLS